MDSGNNVKYSCRKNYGIGRAQNTGLGHVNIHNFNDIAFNELNFDLSGVDKLIFMLIFMGVE